MSNFTKLIQQEQDEIWKSVGVDILDSDSSTSSDIDLLEGLSQTNLTDQGATSSLVKTCEVSRKAKSKRPRGARQRASETKTSSDGFINVEASSKIPGSNSEQLTPSSSDQLAAGGKRGETSKRKTGTKSRLAVRQTEAGKGPTSDGESHDSYVSKFKDERAGRKDQDSEGAYSEQTERRINLKSGEHEEPGKAKKMAAVQPIQQTPKTDKEQAQASKISSKERKRITRKDLEEERSTGKYPNKRESREESPKYIPRKHSRFAFDHEYMDRKIREKKRQGSMYSVQREWKLAERAMHNRAGDREMETFRKTVHVKEISGEYM